MKNYEFEDMEIHNMRDFIEALSRFSTALDKWNDSDDAEIFYEDVRNVSEWKARISKLSEAFDNCGNIINHRYNSGLVDND